MAGPGIRADDARAPDRRESTVTIAGPAGWRSATNQSVALDRSSAFCLR